MKTSPIITSFNSGEFSPLMAGRVDIKFYQNASRKMRNFIPAPQGPARRRPGTRFVAEVKASANRTWLTKFEFNTAQSYVVEIGDLYFRFFSNHGVVGAPFEVVTPYTVADLIDADGFFQLRFVQSNDVLYITHPKYAPRKLTRTGAATFVLSTLNISLLAGPFLDVDPDNLTTVYASAATGVVTLTASAAIFAATHVGALFYLEQKNVDSIAQWEAGKVTALNAVRRSDGKNYHALNAATTGTVKPTHVRGAKFDGDTGVQWQFDDAGYGWGLITAIGGGGTTATMTVISHIPDNAVLVGNPSTRWAFGAWSDNLGWPTCVTFFRERLVFARQRDVWLSVAGDFENFAGKDEGGLITDDMAITSNITSDRANDIKWMAPSDKYLLIGTAGDEHVFSEITTTSPLAPGNARAMKQMEFGSRNVQIARVGKGVLFVQRSGRKVRDAQYDWQTDGFIAPDTTVMAEHVTKTGLIDMCYQQEPDSLIWGVRSDGQLVGLTISREQEVRGWHPQRIGGYSDAAQASFAVVESIISIAAPAGDRDEVWMIVRRNINGATKRYVEWMEYYHEVGEDPEDSFYVDSGLTLNNVKNATLQPAANADVKGSINIQFTAGVAIWLAGDVGKFIHYRYSTIDVTGKVIWKKGVGKITAFVDTTHVFCTILSPWPNTNLIAANGWRMTVTTVTGLGHLEGQVVQILGDGAAQPDKTVVGGSITLSEPCSKAQIGKACTAVIQPMPIEAGAADGTAQGKTQRISRCGIRFIETLGAKYGRDETLQLDRVLSRGGGDNMDEAPPLFTGDVTVDWPDGYDSPALITIVQDQPFPCTVAALMPQMKTEDNR